MYIPPLKSMLETIGSTKEQFLDGKNISIPAELLKVILQAALASTEFNEAGYLAANPDVAAGIRLGTVPSARAHFVGYGYFEGRRGAMPAVDERWYLQTYQDVARALQSGTTELRTATEHFETVGAVEGRSPSARYEAFAEIWKKAFGVL